MLFRMKTVMFDEFAFPFPGNDLQIRCVIRFKGKTEEKRLMKAIRLAYDAEPILGCRFVSHWRGHYWQRCEHLDAFVPKNIVQTDHMDSDVLRFLLFPMDPLTDPPLHVRLFRKDHDVLCIKLSHMASDAGGLKELVYMISDIYGKLKSNPDYTPNMNRNGDRGFRQVYRQFSLADRLKIIKRGFLNWKSDTFPRKSWTFPLGPGASSDMDLIVKRYDQNRFRVLKKACVYNNCTLHELFSAAVLRTLVHTIEPPPQTQLRLGTSVDLRRYLPYGKGASIGNLSTFFLLNIGCEIGTTFEDTIKQVQKALHPLKEDYFGLGFYQPVLINLNKILPSTWAKWLCNRMLLFNQWLTSGAVNPRFTNVGIFNEKKLVFDDRDIAECYIVPPLCHPPIFMPTLSGFRETLTLSICFSGAAKNRNKINWFIDKLDEELNHMTAVLERED